MFNVPPPHQLPFPLVPPNGILLKKREGVGGGMYSSCFVRKVCFRLRSQACRSSSLPMAPRTKMTGSTPKTETLQQAHGKLRKVWEGQTEPRQGFISAILLLFEHEKGEVTNISCRRPDLPGNTHCTWAPVFRVGRLLRVGYPASFVQSKGMQAPSISKRASGFAWDVTWAHVGLRPALK